MSLTYGLKTAKDLLDKLRRDAKMLDDEVSSDRFFNFVITGYSLIEWVMKDPSVPQSAKTTSEKANLYKNQWLKVCGDIADASKHFTLDLNRQKKLLLQMPKRELAGAVAAGGKVAGVSAKNRLR